MPVSELDLSSADTKELRHLVKDMRATMNEANGVGLSANQVGISKRFFVAQLPATDEPQKFYAIFNPVITKRSKELETHEEGCLSIPLTFGDVERAHVITLEGHAVHGKKVVVKAQGLLARIFQHELDHLDGKLFVDVAKNVRKHSLEDETPHSGEI